jgi:hypothetical protein
MSQIIGLTNVYGKRGKSGEGYIDCWHGNKVPNLAPIPPIPKHGNKQHNLDILEFFIKSGKHGTSSTLSLVHAPLFAKLGLIRFWPRLSFFLSASTAAAYIFTAPTCTTIIISLEEKWGFVTNFCNYFCPRQLVS